MTPFPILIVYMLFFHWLIDFVCQPEEMGKNKHKSLRVLLTHVSMYTLLMGLSLVIWGTNWPDFFRFMAVTFVCHGVTDFFTSRWNAKQFNAGKVKRGLNGIGFDQWLHQAQLVFTLYFLYL